MNFHKIGWIHWNILPTHPWFLKQLAALIWTCMGSTMDGGWGRLPKWLLAVVNELPERDPNASIWREHILTTWVLWIKHVVVMGPPKTWSRHPFWRGQTFWTSATIHPAMKQIPMRNQTAHRRGGRNQLHRRTQAASWSLVGVWVCLNLVAAISLKFVSCFVHLLGPGWHMLEALIFVG